MRNWGMAGTGLVVVGLLAGAGAAAAADSPSPRPAST